VVDLAQKKKVFEVKVHEHKLIELAESATGDQVLCGTDEEVVILVDLKRGTVVHRFQGPARPCYALAWSPDGSRFAVNHMEIPPIGADVLVWDVARRAIVNQLTGFDGLVNWIQWTRNDRLRTLTYVRTIEEFDLATDKRIGSWVLDTVPCLDTAKLDPTGRRLLGLGHTTVALFDLTARRTDRPLPLLKGLTRIDAPAFTADGRHLIGVTDGEGHWAVLESATGRVVWAYREQAAPLHEAFFTRDGRSVISRQGETGFRVWPVPRELLPAQGK
jgi:WD40 repeat protein